MLSANDRLKRERRTIQIMIGIFCRGRHSKRDALCPACEELSAYAMERIDKCPYHDAKPTCAKCPIHCYKPSMREHVRQVMRYAGPRIMIYHPMLAILHHMDEVNKTKTTVKRNDHRIA